MRHRQTESQVSTLAIPGTFHHQWVRCPSPLETPMPGVIRIIRCTTAHILNNRARVTFGGAIKLAIGLLTLAAARLGIVMAMDRAWQPSGLTWRHDPSLL